MRLKSDGKAQRIPPLGLVSVFSHQATKTRSILLDFRRSSLNPLYPFVAWCLGVMQKKKGNGRSGYSVSAPQPPTDGLLRHPLKGEGLLGPVEFVSVHVHPWFSFRLLSAPHKKIHASSV
ncbi:hypothetical protein [Candidatus Thiosymbion oneisti]|uniref:hypothetical protein n=1 Tax=Candidatus Thiosymbion oneisti TaxID=589554 RepID=UPI00114CB9C5|nr:hypothetical protein [Candidatus Thiosymbion oneisti]